MYSSCFQFITISPTLNVQVAYPTHCSTSIDKTEIATGYIVLLMSSVIYNVAKLYKSPTNQNCLNHCRSVHYTMWGGDKRYMYMVGDCLIFGNECCKHRYSCSQDDNACEQYMDGCACLVKVWWDHVGHLWQQVEAALSPQTTSQEPHCTITAYYLCQLITVVWC